MRQAKVDAQIADYSAESDAAMKAGKVATYFSAAWYDIIIHAEAPRQPANGARPCCLRRSRPTLAAPTGQSARRASILRKPGSCSASFWLPSRAWPPISVSSSSCLPGSPPMRCRSSPALTPSTRTRSGCSSLSKRPIRCRRSGSIPTTRSPWPLSPTLSPTSCCMARTSSLGWTRPTTRSRAHPQLTW